MINNIVLSVFAFLTTRLAAFKEERGQDLVEYAVLVGAIGLAAGAALLFFVNDDTFDTFTSTIQSCIQFDSDGCTNWGGGE